MTSATTALGSVYPTTNEGDRIHRSIEVHKTFPQVCATSVVLKNLTTRHSLTLESMAQTSVHSGHVFMTDNDDKNNICLYPNTCATVCLSNASWSLWPVASATFKGRIMVSSSVDVDVVIDVHNSLYSGGLSAKVKLSEHAENMCQTSWCSGTSFTSNDLINNICELGVSPSSGAEEIFLTLSINLTTTTGASTSPEAMFVLESSKSPVLPTTRRMIEDRPNNKKQETTTTETDLTTLYGVLGVTRKATPSEIKQAYHKRALQCHPDKNADNPQADALFKKVVEAYDTLKDERRREMYDASLATTNSSSSSSATTTSTNPQRAIFAALFGSGAFTDFFGTLSFESMASGAMMQDPSSHAHATVLKSLRRDQPTLVKNLHNRIMKFLANAAMCSVQFRAECREKALGAPGGISLLQACGEGYLEAISREREGCGRVGSWWTIFSSETTRTCGMLPATCAVASSAAKVKRRERELQRQYLRQEMEDVERLENGLNEAKSDQFKATLALVFKLGLLEVGDITQDVAKATLYGFYTHSPRSVAMLAESALMAIATIMCTEAEAARLEASPTSASRSLPHHVENIVSVYKP